MSINDRHGGARDEHDHDEHDALDEDIIAGIWASFSAPSLGEQPSRSVESIKERLKRGAARRSAGTDAERAE